MPAKRLMASVVAYFAFGALMRESRPTLGWPRAGYRAGRRPPAIAAGADGSRCGLVAVVHRRAGASARDRLDRGCPHAGPRSRLEAVPMIWLTGGLEPST